MGNPAFTIGITGGSGSGKTHFLKCLASRFKENELCLISQDHYYHPLEKQTDDGRGVINFDLPESIDYRRFHDDIRKIKLGETVTISEYTFNNPKASARHITFVPAPIVVVEGLFILHFPEIESELDLSIFIDAKDHIKLSRRIKRDNDERGYDLSDVLYRYQHHVMPVYETLIKPLRDRADLVIPNNQHFDRALALITAALKAQMTK